MDTDLRPASPASAARRNPLRWGRRHHRGFTIVEVAVAATVMALVLASSVLALQQGFQMLDTARNTTLASQILQSEMESVRLKSWTAVAALSASETYYTTVFTSDTALAQKFPVTRTVTSISSDMKEITLSVTWTGYNGQSHTRTFRTRYGKNGLYDYYYTVVSS